MFLRNAVLITISLHGVMSEGVSVRDPLCVPLITAQKCFPECKQIRGDCEERRGL
jgi:hypothetical protein